MEMKWLTKQNSWFVRLTTIIALVSILLCTAIPNFADESKDLHSQGSSSFFGKYEEPKPSPTPDPKPEPGVLPDNPDNVIDTDTPQAAGKDGSTKGSSQFPKTGTIVKHMTFPGVLLVGIALLLFILRNRKKKKEN